MSKYIEKERLLSYIDNTVPWNGPGDRLLVYLEISDFETADVAPVKHGKWLYKKEWGRLITNECSVCKQILTTQNGELMNYCPHCGAKMNLE